MIKLGDNYEVFKQREMIFNCIKENPMHLTADAIYEMLKR